VAQCGQSNANAVFFAANRFVKANAKRPSVEFRYLLQMPSRKLEIQFVDPETCPPTTEVSLMRSGHNAGWQAGSGAERKTPDMLARFMGLYFVVAVGKVGDLVPGLHEIPLAKIVAAFAIIVAIRSRKVTAAATWKTVPPAKLTIAVMGVTAVSILWSVLRSASFGVITGSVLGVVVTLLLVIKAARDWVAIRTILHGTVIASIVLVATVFTSKVHDAGGDRAGFSISYDPNDFAYVLIGLLPIVLTFGVISRGLKRLVYFGIAGLVTVAILLTQSRGGLLGLTLEVLAMTFLLPVARANRLQFRISKSGIVARAALLALIGVVVWHSLPDTARNRLGGITDVASDYNAKITQGPQSGRLGIWSRNLPLILDRPWGFGAGAFAAVDGRFAGGFYRAPHNTFLQALMELGIPGFVLFIATIASSFRYLRVASDSERDEGITSVQGEPRAFARALAIGLAGLCLSGFFLSELFANVFWTLITLSCAVGIARRLPTTTAVAATGALPDIADTKKRALSAGPIAKQTR
jgi:O-antigen ligase